uniref:Uncharacterized protein n=1 Tax=Panagrolaimus sp. PS1159 TaxID=55785 RepID=A0AC35FN15_9BILA
MVLPITAAFTIIFFLGVIIEGGNAGVLDFKKLLNGSDANAADVDEFAAIMDKFKFRKTNSTDVKRRLGNFRKAKKNIEELRARFKNAKFAVNKFSLMSKEEQQQFFGATPVQRPSDEVRGKRSALDGLVSTVAPAAFDFRSYGKVTPIKNQAQCGSCWAFTTAAVIESQYLLRLNQSLDLSEQNLVSCTTTNSKCNGGDIINAFKYIQTNGIASEACQPYTATNGICTNCNQKYFIGGYRNFGTDESTYAAQMYNYGPMTMAFYVPQAFMSYSSGILDFPAADCMKSNIGMHGMVIVGYTADYWIAKNSWDVIQALDFVKANGIANETCQPYTGKSDSCTIKCNTQKYYISGYHDFGLDESTYAKQLYNYGPATVIIYVPEEFMSYDTGILDMPAAECMQDNLGLHAMALVGYTEDYWIIRNSWDTDWGEQGYVRVKRGQNFCSLNLEVVAPFLNVSVSLTTKTSAAATTTPTTTKATTKGTTIKSATVTQKPAAVTTTVKTTTTIAKSTTTATKATTTIPSTMKGCPGGNGLTTMNDVTRNYALKIFNGKRSEVAKGLFKMGNGNYAPAGKNIKRLIYNCTLEDSAQKYANTCEKSYLPNTFNSILAFSKAINISNALDQSLSHLFAFNISVQKTNATVSSGIGYFAYDDAISIGCGFSTRDCFSTTTKAVLVCAVSPIPISTTLPLYIIDSSCVFNSDCSKPGYNKCDYNLRLCYA